MLHVAILSAAALMHTHHVLANLVQDPFCMLTKERQEKPARGGGACEFRDRVRRMAMKHTSHLPQIVCFNAQLCSQAISCLIAHFCPQVA